MLGRYPITEKGKENFELLKTHVQYPFYWGTQLIHKEQKAAVYAKGGDGKALATWRWRNNDVRILRWWESYKTHNIPEDSLIYFIDDDVRFDFKPEDIVTPPNDNYFVCHKFRDASDIQESQWGFRHDIDKLPEQLKEYALAITPIAVIGLSPRMLNDLSWYAANTNLFEEDIFGELRIGTLLNFLGYKGIEADNLKYVRNFPFPPRPGQICHPVK